MGGIGSFERQTRCLYVGGMDINDHMELVIRKHFGEWGEIESVTIVQPKGVAFVRYRNLANAEYAKEAMYAQALEGGEIINVRWATDDPNPASIESVKRKQETDVINAIKAKLPKIGPKGTILDYEDSYKGMSKENKSKKIGPYYYGDETNYTLQNQPASNQNQPIYAATYGKADVSGSSAYAMPKETKKHAQAQSIGLLAGYASDSD
jgi:RNA recognition motif-containing protein